MTTRESSSSPVESAMDNTTVSEPQSLAKTKRKFNGNESNGYGGGGDVVVAAADADDTEEEEEEEECDVEVWDSLSKNFKQVQTVLDQNRMLIQQVNENHQSKIPDNLANNVALIREINGNISKVLSMYSSLSVKFSDNVRQRRRLKNNNVESTVDGASDEFE